MSLIESYKEDARVQGLSEATIKSRVYTIKYFQAILDGSHEIDFKSLKKSDMVDCLAELRKRGLKRTTIALKFSQISSFFDYLESEGLIESNPVRSMHKRYLHNYKEQTERRQIITVDEASKLVNSIMRSRDRAMVLLFFKTGIRRQELINIDIDDIDFETGSIKLKKTPKRSNRTVFFDDETTEALEAWLEVRDQRNIRDKKALFISRNGKRLGQCGIRYLVAKYAMRVGLHKKGNGDLEDRFSPHCCRHWFTTHLRKAGMPREFIQELRGDKRKDAIDIYDHIDLAELRESYLAHIPKLL